MAVLNSLVSNNKLREGKSIVGYDVSDSYRHVYDDLLEERIFLQDLSGNTLTGAAAAEYVSRYYTVLTSGAMRTAKNEDDLWLYTSLDAPLYQAKCTLKCYMSFPFEIDGEKSYVRVDAGGKIKDGKGLYTLVVYPPFNISKTTMDNMPDGLCKIGVAIDIAGFALSYFKLFFPNLNMTKEILNNIACAGHLYVEVAIPYVGGALFFHAKVTAQVPQSPKGTRDVYLPLPVLMLNDYERLCTVYVDGGKGKKSVGTDGHLFPLAGAHYYHKNGTISGLTKGLLSTYILGANKRAVAFKGTSLCENGSDTQGRVRLYLDKSASKFLGSVPAEYALVLYSGNIGERNMTRRKNELVNNEYAPIVNAPGGIFIDIGHSKKKSDISVYGGTGALGKDSSGETYNEYYFNKIIAQGVHNKLKLYGIPAFTYNNPGEDNDPERSAVIRKIRNEQNNYIAFISFHCNWSYNKNYGGSIVYVYDGKRNPQSNKLGDKIADPLSKIMTGSHAKSTVKVLRENMGIISKLEIPAILIELGYMTNVNDVDKLKNQSYQKQIIDVITNAIANWFKDKDK